MAEDETESPEFKRDAETVRAVLGGYGRAVAHGEHEAFLELLDSEVDLEIPSVRRQDMVRLKGREAVRQYLEEIAGEYVEMRLDAREFRRLDHGRLLAVGRWRGRASGGTTPFGAPLALIVEVRDGKVARLHGFMDEQQALEAARPG